MPTGSSLTSASYAPKATGGGGGGEPDQSHTTRGSCHSTSFKKVCSLLSSPDELGQKASKAAKMHATMALSRLIAVLST